jgi:hypothetical protein
MTYRLGSSLLVIPDQVLDVFQDLAISGSRFFGFKDFGFMSLLCGGTLFLAGASAKKE